MYNSRRTRIQISEACVKCFQRAYCENAEDLYCIEELYGISLSDCIHILKEADLLSKPTIEHLVGPSLRQMQQANYHAFHVDSLRLRSLEGAKKVYKIRQPMDVVYSKRR